MNSIIYLFSFTFLAIIHGLLTIVSWNIDFYLGIVVFPLSYIGWVIGYVYEQKQLEEEIR